MSALHHKAGHTPPPQATAPSDSKGAASPGFSACSAVSKFFRSQWATLAEIGRSNLHDLKRLQAYVTCSAPPLPRFFTQPAQLRMALTHATRQAPLDEVIKSAILRASISFMPGASAALKQSALTIALSEALVSWCNNSPLESGFRSLLRAAQAQGNESLAMRTILMQGVLPRLEDLAEAPNLDPGDRDHYTLLAELVPALASGNQASVACLSIQSAAGRGGRLAEKTALSEALETAHGTIKTLLASDGPLLSAAPASSDAKHAGPGQSRSVTPDSKLFENSSSETSPLNEPAQVRLHAETKGAAVASQRQFVTSSDPRDRTTPTPPSRLGGVSQLQASLAEARSAVSDWLDSLGRLGPGFDRAALGGRQVLNPDNPKVSSALAMQSVADPSPEIRDLLDHACRARFEGFLSAVANRAAQLATAGTSADDRSVMMVDELVAQADNLVEGLPESVRSFLQDTKASLEARARNLGLADNTDEFVLSNIVLLHGLKPAAERLAGQAGPLQGSFRVLADLLGPIATGPADVVAGFEAKGRPQAAESGLGRATREAHAALVDLFAISLAPLVTDTKGAGTGRGDSPLSSTDFVVRDSPTMSSASASTPSGRTEAARQAVQGWLEGVSRLKSAGERAQFLGRDLFKPVTVDGKGALPLNAALVDPVPTVRAALEVACGAHFEKWAAQVAGDAVQAWKQQSPRGDLMPWVARQMEAQAQGLAKDFPREGRDFLNEIRRLVQSTADQPGSGVATGALALEAIPTVILVHGLQPAIARLVRSGGELQEACLALQDLIGQAAVVPSSQASDGKGQAQGDKSATTHSVDRARATFSFYLPAVGLP